MNMDQIWKFPIPYTLRDSQIVYEHEFSIEMPSRAGLIPFIGVKADLVLGMKAHEYAFLYAWVDGASPKGPRHFLMLATGAPIPDCCIGYPLKYVGSFQLLEGVYVFHIFEKVRA